MKRHTSRGALLDKIKDALRSTAMMFPVGSKKWRLSLWSFTLPIIGGIILLVFTSPSAKWWVFGGYFIGLLWASFGEMVRLQVIHMVYREAFDEIEDDRREDFEEILREVRLLEEELEWRRAITMAVFAPTKEEEK